MPFLKTSDQSLLLALIAVQYKELEAELHIFDPKMQTNTKILRNHQKKTASIFLWMNESRRISTSQKSQNAQPKTRFNYKLPRIHGELIC